MKNKIRKALRFWYIYLIVVVASVVGTFYYVDFINRPKNEETITLFVSSYSQNSDNLQKYL